MHDNAPVMMEYPKEILLFDTGAHGMATPASLCRMAQECAWHHAASLGFGFEQLGARGLAWVLREQAIRVRRFPALGERLRIATWPTTVERILCHRDFRFLDHAGRVVAEATSAWLGFDPRARRPCKAETFFRPAWDTAPEAVFATELPPLEKPDRPAGAAARRMRPSDADALGHMNNLRYVDWIMDYLADLGIDSLSVRDLRIRHAREVLSGETVRIQHDVATDGSIRVRMARDAEDAEVCLARVGLGRKPGDGSA